MPIVRPYEITDTSGVLRLFTAMADDPESAYPPKRLVTGADGNVDHELVATWLAACQMNVRVVAEEHGEIVGHVAAGDVPADSPEGRGWKAGPFGHVPLKRVMQVTRLAVRPDSRCRGVGTTLLEDVSARVETKGRLPVLGVLECQHDAVRLYLNRGWAHAGNAEDAAGDPILVLASPAAVDTFR